MCQELQDLILDLVLIDSLAPKQHIQRTKDGYNLSPTAFTSPSHALIARAHIVFRFLRIGRVDEATVDKATTLVTDFYKVKEVETLDLVIPIGPGYTQPIALQLNRQLRDKWARVYYKNSVFWVASPYLHDTQEWVLKLLAEFRAMATILFSDL